MIDTSERSNFLGTIRNNIVRIGIKDKAELFFAANLASPRKESSIAVGLLLTRAGTGRGARAALPKESTRLKEPPAT
jgi:hypothetical protein